LKTVLLDGDVLRHLFPGTGFGKEARMEHLKRAAILAGFLEKSGLWVIVSFISPYEEARTFARKQCQRFVEIYLSTPLDQGEKRDVKGLYVKARKGEILQFTGIDDPFEVPANPDITIDTSTLPISLCVETILNYARVEKIKSSQKSTEDVHV